MDELLKTEFRCCCGNPCRTTLDLSPFAHSKYVELTIQPSRAVLLDRQTALELVKNLLTFIASEEDK